MATVAATLLVDLGGYGLHAMLGEPVSARALLLTLPATIICNAVLAYPVFGLTRRVVGRRRGWSARGRWSSLSDAPYGERRNTSTRFLPPDPTVSAPYRLTPGLALRVGVLGVVALAVFAVLFFRLWSLQVLWARGTSTRPRTTSCG